MLVLIITLLEARVIYVHPNAVQSLNNTAVSIDEENSYKQAIIVPLAQNIEDIENQRSKPRPPRPPIYHPSRPGSACSIFSTKFIAIMMPIVIINVFIKF